MLAIKLLLIALIGLVTTLFESNGYLMDRLAVSSFWNAPSSLNSTQNVSYEGMFNDKMRSIQMNKLSDEKLDMKHLERALSKDSSRTKRLNNDSEIIDGLFPNNQNNSSLKTDSSPSHLKNVIIMLVDTVKRTREEFWKNFEKTHSFPVHGYLQVSDYNQNGPMKVNLNKFLLPGTKEDECKCKETLRYDINELLIWAHQVQEMTTSIIHCPTDELDLNLLPSIDSNLGVLSALLPSNSMAPKIEERYEIVNNYDSNESSTEGTIREHQLSTSNVEKESVQGYDDMWDVIDMFSKIRIAFFRVMIETLSGQSNGTTNNMLPFQKLPRSRSDFVNIVDDALKKLQTAAGDEGYLLVLVVTEHELDSVIDLLQHEISSSNTLLVVSEICSKNTKSVPFFAKGPEASVISQTRTIKELPDVIKSIMTKACEVRGCNKNLRETYQVPIKIIRDSVVSFQNITTLENSVANKTDNISNQIQDEKVGRS